MENKSQAYTMLTFLMILVVACIFLAPLIPKIRLVGLQFINLKIGYSISNYVGSVGFSLLFVGVGSLLGWIVRRIFSFIPARFSLLSNRADLSVAFISTFIGFLLIGWYVWSYLHPQVLH